MFAHGFTPRAPSSAPASRQRALAFTLIELLVAAAITAAMAGFIAVIVSNVSGTWARSTGRLEADAQARLALDQIALDLQSAIYRDDGNVWLAANILDTTTNATGLWVTAQTPANAKPAGTTNRSLVLAAPARDPNAPISTTDAPFSISDARFGLAGTWLRFFTTGRPVTNAAGTVTVPAAPVAVGYQIVRRRTSAATLNQNTAYCLHRAEARPTTVTVGTTPRAGTLESGFDLSATAYTVGDKNNTGAITGDPRSIRIPGSLTNFDSIVADNVVDFGIRAYVRDNQQPGGLRIIFPAVAQKNPDNSITLKPGYTTTFPQPTRLASSIPASAPIKATNLSQDTFDFDQHFPAVVDVMLRVLTDEGARLIANLEKSSPQPATFAPKYTSAAAQWWAVAEAHSRVYTRRVVLVAQPL